MTELRLEIRYEHGEDVIISVRDATGEMIASQSMAVEKWWAYIKGNATFILRSSDVTLNTESYDDFLAPMDDLDWYADENEEF